jgi:hypothetical protein
VPSRVRRGVPLDLSERLAKAPDFPSMFSAASALPAAADIGDGWLAFIYLDQDYDMQRGVLNPRSYLTLVNRSSHRACVDMPIPASGDVTAWGAFGGDTLYMLDRRITDTGGLATTISSYALHPDACPAEAVMKFWRSSIALNRTQLRLSGDGGPGAGVQLGTCPLAISRRRAERYGHAQGN